MDKNQTTKHLDIGRGRPILGKSHHGPSNPGPANVIQNSKWNINAKEFIPSSIQPVMQQQQQPVVNEVQQKYVFRGQNAKDQVAQAIQILSNEPAEFDELVDPLTTNLAQTIIREADLTAIVEEIFIEGVTKANFRYTAARLSNHLSHNLHSRFNDKAFRNVLLNRCKQEHGERHNLTPERLSGFSLMLAELLLNLSNEAGDRIVFLAAPLLDLLEGLLGSDGAQRSDQLKCSVQVLKLAGSIIEDIKPERTVQLIGKIRGLILQDELPRNIKSMLLSVLELRASGWGKENEETASTSTTTSSSSASTALQNGPFQQPPPQIYQNNFTSYQNPQEYDQDPAYNGVFYTEQQEMGFDAGDNFFEEHEEEELYEYFMGPEGDYQPYPVDPNDDEFDDEIADAFEQFILESENQRRN